MDLHQLTTTCGPTRPFPLPSACIMQCACIMTSPWYQTHISVQDPHDSILCLLHDSKLHLTASFSLTCHWHVSLMQAAPRSSELASDSSTREEPRETCSCQEGGVRCADLSALRHIAATHGHHPSSQSSRVCCWTSRFRLNHAVH